MSGLLTTTELSVAAGIARRRVHYLLEHYSDQLRPAGRRGRVYMWPVESIALFKQLAEQLEPRRRRA